MAIPYDRPREPIACHPAAPRRDTEATRPDVPGGARFPHRAFGVGVLGALALAGLYAGIITWAESWAHALSVFRLDAPYVVPILLGFGLQAGLYGYLRYELPLRQAGPGAHAVAGTSGGASVVGMVACCAHHVTDLLPILGLSGAAALIAEYKVPFMVLGIISNLVGITIMWRRIRGVRGGAPGDPGARARRLR